MNESGYPMPVREMVKTLAELSKHQDRADLVEVLNNAHSQFVEINYDNWNGGTYTYRLHLGLVTGIFANILTKVEQFEKELLELVGSIDRIYENDHISEVVITPLTEEASVYGQRLTPSEVETRHLWKEGYFKLFLSHLSQDKVKVHELKERLKLYGIDAFVAHDDIEPSREWQNEIELALRSMDSLAALFTPDFSKSSWCDQEIGWALGRGIPVIPIRLGCDPYGFAGKFQAISGTFDTPFPLARLIFETLSNKAETRRAIFGAIPIAFLESNSFSQSLKLVPIIESYQDFTNADKDILWRACKKNDQVYYAVNNEGRVTDRIYTHIGNPPSENINEDDIPF